MSVVCQFVTEFFRQNRMRRCREIAQVISDCELSTKPHGTTNDRRISPSLHQPQLLLSAEATPYAICRHALNSSLVSFGVRFGACGTVLVRTGFACDRLHTHVSTAHHHSTTQHRTQGRQTDMQRTGSSESDGIPRVRYFARISFICFASGSADLAAADILDPINLPTADHQQTSTGLAPRIDLRIKYRNKSQTPPQTQC